MYALRYPEGLLLHGIRDYVVQNVTSIPIGGHVRRIFDKDFGDQCIEVRACGLPESLARFEEEVLKDKNDIYWVWEIHPDHPDEELREIPTRNFMILQSARGTVSGPNSDKSYDNTMEKLSSGRKQSSVSSSDGKQSETSRKSKKSATSLP